MTLQERSIITQAGLTEEEGERLIYALGFQREPESRVQSRAECEEALRLVIGVFTGAELRRNQRLAKLFRSDEEEEA